MFYKHRCIKSYWKVVEIKKRYKSCYSSQVYSELCKEKANLHLLAIKSGYISEEDIRKALFDEN